MNKKKVYKYVEQALYFVGIGLLLDNRTRMGAIALIVLLAALAIFRNWAHFRDTIIATIEQIEVILYGRVRTESRFKKRRKK